ncbi:MAG TPA: pitrilysin family protein [Candidatus Polarisedimenticolia bacterium]|nr:pitrilysin family protein [Candidatus Polarisedimenticolia bacterium]
MRRAGATSLLLLALVTLPVRAQTAGPGDAAAPPAQATAAVAPPADPRALTYPPLTISFPKPERLMLSNGLVIYLFVDHELPLIDLAFDLAAGSIDDPPGKEGLADLTAALMRAGGTADMSPDQVDEAVDFLPARLGFAPDRDNLGGTLSALKEKFPEALRLFAGMLRAPRFDPARLEVERARVVEEIRRRWDDPGDVAELNFRLLAYGARSPWARLPDAASIGRITRDDLVDFHRRYLHANNMVLGVAGDFEPEAMKSLLKSTFGSWPRAKVTPPPIGKVKDAVPVGVHLIERPVSQSTFEIGHLGVNRFDPDKFPLKILNFILGEGGFTSRLVREVRSTRGLAYSVGGGVGMDSDRGLFEVSCRTRAASTVEAIQLIRDILRRLRQDGPTEEEVREAQEASINSFVFSLDGTVPYMRAYLYYDRYGYPPDYLMTYRDNLGRVTRAQVFVAARRHIDPEHLLILVVGKAQDLASPLDSLGLGAPRLVRLDGEAAASN